MEYYVDKFSINYVIKNYKKSIDSYILRWYSITCPWDRDKTSTKTSKKRSWQRKTALIK